MITLKLKSFSFNLKSEQIFMISALLVNVGNYLYNLVLGRLLGPQAFADAAILVTFLLILSFLAMTLQITVAKFTGSFDEEKKEAFLKVSRKWGFIGGSITGLLIILFSGELQNWFQTSSSLMFSIFGVGVPLYFVMSVNRGFFQGEQDFIKLSLTYQFEMLTRLFLTLSLILILPFNSADLISFGILISFIPGLMPYKKINVANLPKISVDELSHLKKFVVITAFYELTQILINNGDILLVKHYFDANTAGLYASLALIGRLVYFVAWMFVMLLLPEVVKRSKAGLDTTKLFFKYLTMIGFLALAVVVTTMLFPELIIHMMFGEAYLEIAGLLWKYALASSLFAIANVFVYYFLSLDKYIPVVLSGIFGVVQLSMLTIWHESLEQVVELQILAMLFLLFFQVSYFLYHNKGIFRRN